MAGLLMFLNVKWILCLLFLIFYYGFTQEINLTIEQKEEGRCFQTKLSCIFNDQDRNISIKWYKNEIINSSIRSTNYTFCTDRHSFGNYSCEVVSDDQTYKSNIVSVLPIPLLLEVSDKIQEAKIGEKIKFICIARSFPLPVVKWLKDFRDIDNSSRISIINVSNTTAYQSDLIIEEVQRHDNGSYICNADVENFDLTQEEMFLLIQEPPSVTIKQLSLKDYMYISIEWKLDYNLNSPLKMLEVHYRPIKHPPFTVNIMDVSNSTIVIKNNVLPLTDYELKLRGTNDHGSGNWTHWATISTSAPPLNILREFVSETSIVIVVGRLLFHDNEIDYIVNISSIYCQNGQKLEEEYTCLMTGLKEGTNYDVMVKVCSKSNSQFCNKEVHKIIRTKDGVPDPPDDLKVQVSKLEYNFTWKSPQVSRGNITEYRIRISGRAKNMDSVFENHTLTTNTTEIILNLIPNTIYNVSITCVNAASESKTAIGVHFTTVSDGPSLVLPPHISPYTNQNENLMLVHLQRTSERNGTIRCYYIIVLKLLENEKINDLPKSPSDIFGSLKYIYQNRWHVAESFSSDRFINNTIIGDEDSSECRIGNRQYKVDDKQLSEHTNYTVFVVVDIKEGDASRNWSSAFSEPFLTGSLVKSDVKTEVIVGVLCGILLTLIVVVLILLVKHSRIQKYIDGVRSPHENFLLQCFRSPHHVTNSEEGLVVTPPRFVAKDFPSIFIKDLPTVFKEKHKDSDFMFQQEFEALPTDFPELTTNVCDVIENAGKNRYINIKSYDHTRVPLSLIDNIPNTDYINANYVEGYKGRRKYIAAQGPLETTVTDFWRLIWAENISVIVILTRLVEDFKPKCCQYWPDGEEAEQYDKITVSLVEVLTFPDYELRKFKVQHENSSDTRDILQFYFSAWKDFAAPTNPSSVLKLIKRVREASISNTTPILVHCSAGVGRTGTYIAIDALTEQMSEEDQINIYKFVCGLRRQRNLMVQSLKQYIFVYRALTEWYLFGDTEVEVSLVREHYRQLQDPLPTNTLKTGIEVEFEKLQLLIEEKKNQVIGSKEINMCKNRYEFIIPYDHNRVEIAPLQTKPDSSYINASFIEDFSKPDAFIITQDPLENTVNDFWRMVSEFNITTIVMLSEVGDGQSLCQSYWPDKDEKKVCDHIMIKFVSIEHHPEYSIQEFNVNNLQTGDCHTVTQFQYNQWMGEMGEVPYSTTGLVDLIGQVQKHHQKHSGNGPITIHCSGGSDRCSVYCAISILIERMKVEGRVDVFQTVKDLRSQRPFMLDSVQQYNFCYKALLEYLESFNLCDSVQ